jgi:hypothetical protein
MIAERSSSGLLTLFRQNCCLDYAVNHKKFMLRLLRPALLALLFSQIANESSNSLSAALFPWLASSDGLAPHAVLLGLALLCGLIVVISHGLKYFAAPRDLLKVWWPTCVLSAIVMASLAAYPENTSWVFALAAIVLVCAEPVIEIGTSVLVPEQAKRIGWQQARLNGLLLFVGALSTALAPTCLPFLAKSFAPAVLLDLVLLLGVIGVVCLAPLRSGLQTNLLANEHNVAISEPDLVAATTTVEARLIGTRIDSLAFAMCLMIAFEAALLPAVLAHRADALTLQAWFVTCVALGAAIGGITTAVAGGFASNFILKSMIAIIATSSLTAFCMVPTSSLATTLLLIGALATGVWVGLVMPAVEAKLQAQGATPIARIAPMIEFARALALRCMFGFIALAIAFNFAMQ